MGVSWSGETHWRRSRAALAEQPARATLAQSGVDLEQAARLMTIVYERLVNSGTFESRFFRGSPLGGVPATRSLATTYLNEASTDPWNVMAGAIELTRVWALAVQQPHAAAAVGIHRTRMRLAVALSVSWKFQRCSSTILNRSFEPSAAEAAADSFGGGRSLGLAYLAYSFFTANEQKSIGDWDPTNVAKLRTLQSEMLELEIDLVRHVSTFPLLAENSVCLAEIEIQRLFDGGGMSAVHCMKLRAIVPFFLRCALLLLPTAEDALAPAVLGAPRALYENMLATTTNNQPGCALGAGGLVCAAFLCMKNSQSATRDMPSTKETFGAMYQYVTIAALKLLNTARLAVAADPAFFRRGCYGDARWYGFGYVDDATLARAHASAVKDTRGPPTRVCRF